MGNRNIKKITFDKPYWFDHNGDNPKAVEKRGIVEERVNYYYDDNHRRIMKPKRLRIWKKLVVFKKNETIEFRPGLNVIVGENGSGKTTLLKIMARIAMNGSVEGVSIDASGAVRYLDFETGNPRFSIKPNPDSKNFTSQVYSMWNVCEESHGETLTKTFDSVIDCEDNCIFLDEPETALSLKNQYRYLDMMRAKSETNQIIMVTHCKTFIENSEEVFDMNTRKWMSGEAYIKKIMKDVKD